MIGEVYVACDGNWEEPEVQISGSKKALVDLGEFLNTIENSTALEIPSFFDEYYPVAIQTVAIEVCEAGDDGVCITIDEKRLLLVGTRPALNKIGDSLINFFGDDAMVGEHFHLDYYEGNEVLGETQCHLIFGCDR